MFVQFFYFAVGLLGLITKTITITQRKTNWRNSVYLLILFVVFSLRFLLEPLFYFYENLRPSFSYSPFLCVIMPVCYLYFENVINRVEEQKITKLLHLIFPICFGIISLINKNNGFLGTHSLIILTIVFALYYIIYIVFIYILFKENVWNRKSKIIVINLQNKLLRKWTKFLFVIIVLHSIRLLATLFYDLINNDYSVGHNYQWMGGVIISIIFIKILISPEILFGYNALNKKIDEQKKLELSLNDIWILTEKKDINNLQDKLLKEKIYVDLLKNLKDIEQLALTEKWFREQKSSIVEIAIKLDIPVSHIKFIFKYHCKITFTEFKNIIKIYDALQLIEYGFLKINTLDTLAIKVGFSSYNPFFTSFKEVAGSTPQAYTKQIASKDMLE